jgi:hypothetical protein
MNKKIYQIIPCEEFRFTQEIYDMLIEKHLLKIIYQYYFEKAIIVTHFEIQQFVRDANININDIIVPLYEDYIEYYFLVDGYYRHSNGTLCCLIDITRNTKNIYNEFNHYTIYTTKSDLILMINIKNKQILFVKEFSYDDNNGRFTRNIRCNESMDEIEYIQERI